jgi:hypothetical protein
MIVISFDPGATSGIALFVDDILTFAAHGRSIDKLTSSVIFRLQEQTSLGSTAQLAAEFPRIYPTGKGKGDPNGLLPVAQYTGEFFASMRIRLGVESVEQVKYYPRNWKGALPKDISHARIRERLTAEELCYFDKTNSDGRDAIGVGLYHIGRGYKCK